MQAQNDHSAPSVKTTELIRTTKSVILYMFYLSQPGMPLSVPHPEIPLD